MKSVKLLPILMIPLVLSGCFLERAYTEPRMDSEAARLCKNYMGVYKYGYSGNHGIVKCFRNHKKFNVFTGEEVK